MVTTTTPLGRPHHQERMPGTARSRIGLVVAGSMAAGLVAAAVLTAAPIVPAEEHALTGMVLLGFALGWALLAVLPGRLGGQPQWAAAPAVLLASIGVVSVSGSQALQDALGWVWPPALFVLVVWMFLRVPPAVQSHPARWLLFPVLAVLGAAGLGGGYETVRESLDARAYPPPGQLVDVGGHRLHLSCTGSGSPTVVLEPGAGETSSDLAWITPAVARESRVCVYDRAGRGWSDATDGPQDAAHIAADLHTLLGRAHVPGPYVLAGHSFGGLYVLSFAAQFPDEVAGMVLLDSTAPKAGPALPTRTGSASALDRGCALASAVAHLGVGRLLGQLSYDNLPVGVRAAARATGSTARALHSVLRESLVEGAASVQQAAALTDLQGTPLIVLTADTGSNAAWQASQNHLATLSSNSLHRHADATHQALVGDRTGSVASTRAIQDVVWSVRTSHPLRPR